MSTEIPEIGDVVVVCYNKHPWHGRTGDIIELPDDGVALVKLDDVPDPVRVGFDDFDFICSRDRDHDARA